MRHECAAVSGEGRHVGRRRAADFLVRRIPIRCRSGARGTAAEWCDAPQRDQDY